jgi:serine/threonine protein kinase
LPKENSMPQPETCDDFLALARKSQQVDPGLLDAHVERLRQSGTLPPRPRKLARLLVREGVLTVFQAEQFLQGKWHGFTIGNYQIRERLGRGGNGAVYLAEHRTMRRRVALKVLPPSLAENPGTLARFHLEAQATAALDHPNIVRVYDFCQEGPLHYLVMEYVHGSTLQDLMTHEGPMEVGRAVGYVRQAALGLQHAHEAGMVHRDVKPANLLVDHGGTVKLLDLGLARYAPDGDDPLTRKYNKTHVLGTADYLAPEQALNLHNVDIRADVYSLGVTLYALLAGRPPFHEGTVTQKLMWHQLRDPQPLRRLRPDVPKALAAVIERMMAKEASGRYDVPAEAAEALAPWAAAPRARATQVIRHLGSSRAAGPYPRPKQAMATRAVRSLGSPGHSPAGPPSERPDDGDSRQTLPEADLDKVTKRLVPTAEPASRPAIPLTAALPLVAPVARPQPRWQRMLFAWGLTLGAIVLGAVTGFHWGHADAPPRKPNAPAPASEARPDKKPTGDAPPPRPSR